MPKQYWKFDGERSLLSHTLDRALQIAPHDRVVAVVSPRHRKWWERDLDVLPPENTIVQPENRGTAAGVLLPLLHVLAWDPAATVLVFPSDHHLEDEPTMQATLAEAITAAEAAPEQIVLLGITPDLPDTEYGWVLPDLTEAGATHPVAAFVEKPVELEALRLMDYGALDRKSVV